MQETNCLLTCFPKAGHNAVMLQSIRNVIYAFAAVGCALFGVFWLWFMYEFSLKWLDENGLPGPEIGTAVVFGREGAEWIGMIAVGWFMLALLFAFLQWRVMRQQAQLQPDPQ